MTMNEIEPYLYLGAVAAINEKTYQTFNIQKVISIMNSERELNEVKKALEECPYPVDHTCIILLDNGRDPIEDHFTSVTQELKAAVKNKVPTLIHCFAGISRSATLVAAYLCHSRGYNYDQALKYLKERRGVVDPAFGFIAKLAFKFPKAC